jgi:hypothetical protein
MDYFKYFETRLNHAKAQLKTLNEDETDGAVLMANINGVRNIIFEILDYSINHFFTQAETRNDLYFPILKLHGEVEDLNKNKYFIKINKYVGEDAKNFILDAYGLILSENYDRCLMLLSSSSKHQNLDKISEERNDINAEYISLGKNKIEKNFYGGVSISGFINNAQNIHMSGVYIENPNGSIIINSLDVERIKGNSLIINKDKYEVEVLIKPFLKKCIDCCEEIIILWNSYRK